MGVVEDNCPVHTFAFDSREREVNRYSLKMNLNLTRLVDGS